MVSAGFGAATSTGHGCVNDQNEEAMRTDRRREAVSLAEG
jgi:hypothetical protein